MITENLSTLKIHKLTKEQYERELAAGRIDENALYLTPDEATMDDMGIYVQPNEPTDAVAGDIWIDTANDPSYIAPALPEVTEADNGKVLMVVNGTYQLVNLNLSIDANGVVSM